MVGVCFGRRSIASNLAAYSTGSDTHEWTRLEPDRTEDNVHYYYISIDGQADGPYSKETQWEFRVYNDVDSPSTNAFFDIEATVYRYEMPFYHDDHRTGGRGQVASSI